MIYDIDNNPAVRLGTYRVPQMTTAIKDAQGGLVEGALIYDTTLHKLCVYTAQAGGASTGWETVTSVLE